MDYVDSREDPDLDQRALKNQARLATALQPSYDFIACGAGSSGSVIARRLAENPEVRVLLLEAGGGDESDAVLNPALWPSNLGGDRDWGFRAQPSPHLNGRQIPMSMGNGLGGGSSINVMVWARGHQAPCCRSDDPDLHTVRIGSATVNGRSLPSSPEENDRDPAGPNHF